MMPDRTHTPQAEPAGEKRWYLGHVPGTVIVDKVELDSLRAELASVQAECDRYMLARFDDVNRIEVERDQAREELARAEAVVQAARHLDDIQTGRAFNNAYGDQRVESWERLRHALADYDQRIPPARGRTPDGLNCATCGVSLGMKGHSPQDCQTIKGLRETLERERAEWVEVHEGIIVERDHWRKMTQSARDGETEAEQRAQRWEVLAGECCGSCEEERGHREQERQPDAATQGPEDAWKRECLCLYAIQQTPGQPTVHDARCKFAVPSSGAADNKRGNVDV